MDRHGIGATAASTTGISTPIKFAVFLQLGLIIYRLVANDFAYEVFQATHHILLSREVIFWKCRCPARDMRAGRLEAFSLRKRRT